jgi:hypothetical protein
MKSSVYILYTGGTFGMKTDEKGSLSPSSWSEIIDYLPAVKNQTFFNYFDRIDFTFETLSPVIDSSDITPEVWKRIAEKINQHYENHDGFVVIHGTDTMHNFLYIIRGQMALSILAMLYTSLVIKASEFIKSLKYVYVSTMTCFEEIERLKPVQMILKDSVHQTLKIWPI